MQKKEKFPMRNLKINADGTMEADKTGLTFYNLVGKIVEFTPVVETTELGFDEGMKAKIAHIDRNSEYHVETFYVEFDFSEFEKHNEQFMKSNYWDKNGKPTLKWNQTAYYPKDLKESYYFTAEELLTCMKIVG